MSADAKQPQRLGGMRKMTTEEFAKLMAARSNDDMAIMFLKTCGAIEALRECFALAVPSEAQLQLYREIVAAGIDGEAEMLRRSMLIKNPDQPHTGKVLLRPAN